jgi:hypothetical protein
MLKKLLSVITGFIFLGTINQLQASWPTSPNFNDYKKPILGLAAIGAAGTAYYAYYLYSKNKNPFAGNKVLGNTTVQKTAEVPLYKRIQNYFSSWFQPKAAPTTLTGPQTTGQPTEKEQVAAIKAMEEGLQALSKHITAVYTTNLASSPPEILASAINNIQNNPLLKQLLEDSRFETVWHQYGIIQSALEAKKKGLVNFEKQELESFIDQLYACTLDAQCDNQILSNTFPILGQDIGKINIGLLDDNYKTRLNAIVAAIPEPEISFTMPQQAPTTFEFPKTPIDTSTIKFTDLVEFSERFGKKLENGFPTKDNRIKVIAGVDPEKQKQIENEIVGQARSTYHLVHSDVEALIDNFIVYKKNNGTPIEKRVYNENMNRA